MYSYKQKKKAVELYIKYGKNAAVVIRKLGYPALRQEIRLPYPVKRKFLLLKAMPDGVGKFSKGGYVLCQNKNVR